MFEIGELVTRKSHGDDIVFKVTGFSVNSNGEKQYELKGLQAERFKAAGS